MPIAERRSLIQCEQARAFEVSQNYQLRQHWDPFPARRALVARCYLVEQTGGSDAGAIRRTRPARAL